MFHRGSPIGFPIEAYRDPIGKYGVYTGVPAYATRCRPASVWLGRPPPPPHNNGCPPIPGLWGFDVSPKGGGFIIVCSKNGYNYMQGEGLYLAAPNDGYLLLYLSYLGFAWRGDDYVGV